MFYGNLCLAHLVPIACSGYLPTFISWQDKNHHNTPLVRIILSYFNLLLHLSRQVLTLLPDERETPLLLLQNCLPLYAEYRTTTTTFMGTISWFFSFNESNFLQIVFKDSFISRLPLYMGSNFRLDVLDDFRPSYGTVMPSDVVQGRFTQHTIA